MRFIVRLALITGLLLAACGSESAEDSSDTTVVTTASATTSSATSTSLSPPTTIVGVSYGSAEEILDVINASQFPCDQWSVDEQSDDGVAEQGIVSSGDCDWLDSDGYIHDKLGVLLFDSEESRLRFAVSAFIFGCGALDPLPTTLAYVYGPTWVVSTGYGTTDVWRMADLSTALRGKASEADCAALWTWADSAISIDDPMADPFEGVSSDQIKNLLGELDESARSSPPTTSEPTTTTEPQPIGDIRLLTNPSPSAVTIPAATGSWAPGSLVSAPDGSLWGSFQGTLEGLIFKIEPSGDVFEYGPFEAFPYLPNSMAVTPNGTVWFVSHDTDGAVWRLSNEAPERFPDASDPPIGKPLSVITSSDDGTIWAATDDGDLVAYRDKGWDLIESPTWLHDDGLARSIAVTPDGTVWIGRSQSESSGLIKYDGEWDTIASPTGQPFGDVVDLAVSSNLDLLVLHDTAGVGTLARVIGAGEASPVPDAAFDYPASLDVTPDGRWVVLDQASPSDVHLYFHDGESIHALQALTEVSTASVIGAEIAATTEVTWVLVGALLFDNTAWAEPLTP